MIYKKRDTQTDEVKLDIQEFKIGKSVQLNILTKGVQTPRPYAVTVS
jgi:hypothetical protein